MTDTLSAPDRLRPGHLHGTYLATVVSVQDPDSLSRVQVRLRTAPEALPDADLSLWARVAVPFAGANHGAFFLPNVGDEVAIVFVSGDPRQPLVVGSLWNGASTAPESLPGDQVDRYAIKARNGSRIAIIEQTESTAEISVAVPGNVSIKLEQASGGKITIQAAGNTITLDTQGVTVKAGSKVAVTASQVEVNAGKVAVNAAMSTFSGVVKCDVLKATTVFSATYNPGAGNVW